MMTGFWVALLVALVAVFTEFVVFYGRRVELRSKAQCYKFHDLRDRLQVLTMEHKIEAESRIHGFLFTMINIAIRNAGVIKLSQMLRISREVNSDAADGRALERVQTEIRNCPKEVQILAADVLSSFAMMMVANDDITVGLFKGLKLLRKTTNQALIKVIKTLVSALMPQHARIVKEASYYDAFGRRFRTI